MPTELDAELDACAAAADRLALAAAARTGAVIRPLTSPVQCQEASALLADVWGTTEREAPLPPDLLCSLVHAHGYVAGAYQDDRLTGIAAGTVGGPPDRLLYSLIAGVVRTSAGRGLGLALKQHQRAWSLRRGLTVIRWTYDPLVRRNAHFNLDRLGARPTSYLRDFYPPMHDQVNRDDLTDRLVIDWDLLAPRSIAPAAPALGTGAVVLGVADDGGPVLDLTALRPPRPALVHVPTDIEALRAADPAAARAWRLATRTALEAAFERGLVPRAVRADGFLWLSTEEPS